MEIRHSQTNATLIYLHIYSNAAYIQYISKIYITHAVYETGVRDFYQIWTPDFILLAYVNISAEGQDNVISREETTD